MTPARWTLRWSVTPLRPVLFLNPSNQVRLSVEPNAQLEAVGDYILIENEENRDGFAVSFPKLVNVRGCVCVRVRARVCVGVRACACVGVRE